MSSFVLIYSEISRASNDNKFPLYPEQEPKILGVFTHFHELSSIIDEILESLKHSSNKHKMTEKDAEYLTHALKEWRSTQWKVTSEGGTPSYTFNYPSGIIGRWQSLRFSHLAII